MIRQTHMVFGQASQNMGNLIKVRCLLYLFQNIFFGYTPPSNDIHLGVILCNLSFIFDHPTICKTVKHIDQSDNSSWHVLCYDIPNDLVGSLLIGQYEP